MVNHYRRVLDADAPPLPNGMQPKIDVTHGCGHPECDACYEPAKVGVIVLREQQPALPGAETVRETENPTPTYALPEQTPPAFELTVQPIPRAMLASLLTDDDTNKRDEE